MAQTPVTGRWLQAADFLLLAGGCSPANGLFVLFILLKLVYAGSACLEAVCTYELFLSALLSGIGISYYDNLAKVVPSLQQRAYCGFECFL